jgi:GNAT superfamily N-acetyltransferase
MTREAPVETSAGVTASERVSIQPVRSRAELNRFIRLAYQIYADDPVWVAPLVSDMKNALDPARHPFHKHAEVESFLACYDGVPAGRITVILNHTHVQFQSERAGFFGLFECIDNPALAAALLNTAENWLRARGMEKIRGPMNLSTNDELWSPGVLIDGFDTPPYVLMGHTPRYYARLLESAGYGKSKDLLSYWVEGEERARHVRMAERLIARSGFRMRPLNMRRLDEDVGIIQQIYNASWERNWGFVPMSREEIHHLATQLKPVVYPRLCTIAYADEEPVGFSLTLPNFNEALKHVNGRLLPFGVFKLLWYKRKIENARVLTLGVVPGHRGKGLDALLILRTFRELSEIGIDSGECSWILEDNLPMRHALEKIGGTVYKTYRVFEKSLVN